MGTGRKDWIEKELRGCDFGDKRLAKRFHSLLGQLSRRVGGSIPWACEDWANTKAAYRFLANDRVDESEILSGHFRSTRDRVPAGDAPVLILHDTTEFSFHRSDTAAVGILKRIGSPRKDAWGHSKGTTTCGISMHSSLAVTAAGLPLGLAAIKFWTRREFKGCNALKRHINPTRVPIEAKESIRWLQNLRQSTLALAQPKRCVHIADREGDIFELFCTARDAQTHFLVRTCVDRLCGDGAGTVAKEMQQTRLLGLHRIRVRSSQGEMSEAVLELRSRRLLVLPPIGKQKIYPALSLTVIHAIERSAPAGRERIDWKLLTDLPAQSRRDVIEKLDWYAMRWKIETFHKILKSGCRAESAQLRTAQRLTNLIAVFCLLGWRIFWTTITSRIAPDTSPLTVFTPVELRLLDALIKEPPGPLPRARVLSSYIAKLARLGGYLARAGDSPPGNQILWRGLTRLTDLGLGAELVGK
jgi:hypothetical protein